MEKTKLQSAMTAVSRAGRKQGVMTLASSLVLVGMIGSANATTEHDSIVSLDKDLPHLESTTEGVTANGASTNVNISADGRFTVFESAATNLSGEDASGVTDVANTDVFIHDRVTGKTTLVSFDIDVEGATGADTDPSGNANSTMPTVSKDGTHVAFISAATDLVADDTVDATTDLFVLDRTGTTPVITKAVSNVSEAVISDDGKYIAFTSADETLVSNDDNGVADVFVYHVISKVIERVSVDSSYSQANGASGSPSISSGGQYVAFASDATDLVDGDLNGATDVFLFDRAAGKTELISHSMTGTTGNGASTNPDIGGNGAEWVVFQSDATDLASFEDTNGETDIFIRDRERNGTKIVSITTDGKATNGASINPTTSSTGTFIAYESAATNLVTGDTNGANDIFVVNRWKNTMLRASVDSAGAQSATGGADPSIDNYGIHTAFETTSDLTEPVDRDMEIAELVGYHQFTTDQGDYLYTHRADADGLLDIYVHHVNVAPIFGPKTLEYCMGEGKQNLHEWDWNHYYDDGDHPTERQNVEYTVTSVEDPDNIFGGIFGQSPTISWPSHSMHFAMQYGTPGSAQVCITKKDDGLTAQDGEDTSSEKCMTITVKSSCDAGGDELFHANEFDYSSQLAIAGIVPAVPLDTLDFGYSTRSMKASVANNSGESVQNVEMHMVVKGAEEVLEADPRCEENGSNNEYICRFSELPAGETTLDFQVRSSGSTSIEGGFEASEGPFVEVEGAATTESGDASSSSGGGSLGWLTLLGFGLLGRRKLGK